MNDLFKNHIPGLESPATHLQSIVPDDATDLAMTTRAVAVGHEGFVQLTTIRGDIGRVFIVPGAPFPIRACRIWATGTTATEIVALS